VQHFESGDRDLICRPGQGSDVVKPVQSTPHLAVFMSNEVVLG
jgi:hypothetical protein